MKVVLWSWVAVLGEDVDRRFDQRVAAVVVEQAAGNFFKLLVADDFGILGVISLLMVSGELRWRLWVWSWVAV